MKIDASTYVPVLKWREAEYQALLRVPESGKRRIVPVIVAPPVEYDPESGRVNKNAQEVVRDFVKRIPAKWGARLAWIDFDSTLISERMENGSSIIRYVFEKLGSQGARAIPVAWFESDAEMLATFQQVVAADGRGAAIRLTLENLMVTNLAERLAALVGALQVKIGDVDLILDLGKAFEPYDAFAKALIARLERVTNLQRYRNFVVIGTSIPESLSEISPPGDTLPRHEWRFYRRLLSLLPDGMRPPNFGDYTIVPPSFAMNFNMAVIKPAARLVYTNGENTVIRKGTAFRDDPTQMIDICSGIMNSEDYRGRAFSYGDEQIYLCGNNLRENMSNLGGWKQFGINHHITHVLDDLAKFGAAP